MVRPRVFFDVALDDNPLGRVIFELFTDSAPKTCENFRALCTGEKGLSPLSEQPLYYKNSIIHRSIAGFMIQGGDFTKRNGSGGESIYGGTFPDEDLARPIDSEGLLCMANKGPDTNGSQFFVTLRPCPHLNGKHVVFGKVVRGYDEVIQKIADVPVDQKDRPTVHVTIASCGELMLRTKPPTPSLNAAKRPNSKNASESDSEHDREDHRRRKRRNKHRSRGRSEGEASADEGARQRRHKKGKHSKGEPQSLIEKGDDKEGHRPGEETEEQYDARLEREEKERLETERKKELVRLKGLQPEVPMKNGVRFKGRGRMKYLDPELRRD